MTHVMLANEPTAYRETLAGAIRSLRPDIVVTEVNPADTDWAIQAHSPDLVVCSRLTAAIERHAPAWVLLYPETSIESVVTLRGRQSVRRDISFGQLIEVLDEARIPAGSA